MVKETCCCGCCKPPKKHMSALFVYDLVMTVLFIINLFSPPKKTAVDVVINVIYLIPRTLTYILMKTQNFSKGFRWAHFAASLIKLLMILLIPIMFIVLTVMATAAVADATDDDETGAGDGAVAATAALGTIFIILILLVFGWLIILEGYFTYICYCFATITPEQEQIIEQRINGGGMQVVNQTNVTIVQQPGQPGGYAQQPGGYPQK